MLRTRSDGISFSFITPSYSTLIETAAVCVTIAVIRAIKMYAIAGTALSWRQELTTVLLGLFLPRDAEAAKVSDAEAARECNRNADRNGTGNENPDQRITQDTDRLCSEAATLFGRAVVAPFIILYYTLYLFANFGVVVPLLCYGYFVAGW